MATIAEKQRRTGKNVQRLPVSPMADEIEYMRRWLASQPDLREGRIKLFINAMSTPDYLIDEDLR